MTSHLLCKSLKLQNVSPFSQKTMFINACFHQTLQVANPVKLHIGIFKAGAEPALILGVR